MTKIRHLDKISLLFSSIISLFFVFATRINFSGNVWGTNSDNTVNDFGFSSIVLFIIIAVLSYYLLVNIFPYLHKLFNFVSKLNIGFIKTDNILLFYSCVILFIYALYCLTYLPGGIYSDTFGSIGNVKYNISSNLMPYFYTLMLKCFIRFSELLNYDYTFAMILFTIFQMTVLAATVIYTLFWLIKKDINKYLVFFIFVFFVFFPLIPLYGVSLWKDTPPCIIFLLWFIFLLDLFIDFYNKDLHSTHYLGYLCLSLMLPFSKNNFLYVVMLTAIVLIIVSIKKKHKIITTVIFSIIPIVLYYIISGPIFTAIGVTGAGLIAYFHLPVQQVAYVMNNNGNINSCQFEFLNNIFTNSCVYKSYCPCICDSLANDHNFNALFYNTHKREFYNVWFDLFLNNPIMYLKAFLLTSLGFWDIFVGTADAYVQTFIWPTKEFVIEQYDVFNYLFGFSLRKIVEPTSYLSNAWFFWPYVIAFWYIWKKYGIMSASIFIPQIALWATLMIASPIAFSLRYIAPNMFTLPFLFVVPILFKQMINNDKIVYHT